MGFHECFMDIPKFHANGLGDSDDIILLSEANSAYKAHLLGLVFGGDPPF